jgi:hypothetical protein
MTDTESFLPICLQKMLSVFSEGQKTDIGKGYTKIWLQQHGYPENIKLTA